jgi:flagellar FliL protein
VPAESELELMPEKKPSRIARTLLMVLLSILPGMVGGGALSWFLIKSTMPASTASAADAADEDDIARILENGAVVPLEPFVVNLADPEAARYLRIRIGLMVDDKDKIDEVRENQVLQLKVRDVILQTLTEKTSQDLISEDGKNQLRKEILEKVEVYFREPKLVDVMFTEFVIQL